MRTKLLGTLLLALAAFLFSREHWHAGVIAGGVLFGTLGTLLLHGIPRPRQAARMTRLRRARPPGRRKPALAAQA